MFQDRPEDSDEDRLLALSKYLESMRDRLVTSSLLLQDALFEMETQRQALQDQHADLLRSGFVREHDVSPPESSRDQAAEPSGFAHPAGSSGPSKHAGTGAS